MSNVHPNSLKNLRPRKPDGRELKATRGFTITPTAFDGLTAIAVEHGFVSKKGNPSISELLEKIGRGELLVTAPAPTEPSEPTKSTLP